MLSSLKVFNLEMHWISVIGVLAEVEMIQGLSGHEGVHNYSLLYLNN